MIVLTETATSKVQELLAAEDQPELSLRVAVRPGGCSGLSYEMFFDSERAADDIEASYADGSVRVVVDPASAEYLDGAGEAVLADAVELKVLLMDNEIYVTTPENALKWKTDHPKRLQTNQLMKNAPILSPLLTIGWKRLADSRSTRQSARSSQ